MQLFGVLLLTSMKLGFMGYNPTQASPIEVTTDLSSIAQLTFGSQLITMLND